MARSGDRQIDADGGIEPRVRFWMRAYPRCWRERRGEELLGLVVDLAGPEARHLGVQAALDLVRGGWATRWREHPPLHTWLLYRLFNRRIPEVYRSWAFDDINGFCYPIRQGLPFIVTLATMQVVYPTSRAQLTASSFGLWALVVVTWFLWSEGYRSRARRKHVAPRPGELPAEGALVGWDVSRERVTARSMLTWAVWLLGVVGAASATAVALAPKMLLTNFKWIRPTEGPGPFWESGPGVSTESVVAQVGGRWVVLAGILVAAIGLGVLGAMLARRRLDRLLGERPAQPWRVLRPISPNGRARVLLGMLVTVALVWLEASGRLVLGPSVLLGSLALLFLPGAVVSLILTRRSDDADIAGADLWWIATRGRRPAVDRPAWGLRPLPGALAPDVRNGAVHG
jgi:hypothetical protein